MVSFTGFFFVSFLLFSIFYFLIVVRLSLCICYEQKMERMKSALTVYSVECLYYIIHACIKDEILYNKSATDFVHNLQLLCYALLLYNLYHSSETLRKEQGREWEREMDSHGKPHFPYCCWHLENWIEWTSGRKWKCEKHFDAIQF